MYKPLLTLVLKLVFYKIFYIRCFINQDHNTCKLTVPVQLIKFYLTPHEDTCDFTTPTGREQEKKFKGPL